MKKILVSGSRGWTDIARMEQVLSKNYAQLSRFGNEPVTLIHGGARGADQMAASLWLNNVPNPQIKQVLPDWKTFGNRAGILRNIQMLDMEPDLVIVFCKGGSNGAMHTYNEAVKRNIYTILIEEE